MRISLPSVSLDIKGAASTINNASPRVLIIGQMLTGTATASTLTTNIGNNGEENALFGTRSHVANMVRHFRRLNDTAQIDVIAYADAGGGVAATGTLAFTGPATASGTLYVNIGSATDGACSVAVTSGDTATTVGAAVAAAIALKTNLPFTATALTGTVTITCSHAGTIGNKATLEVTGASTLGLACTITAMASGATDPTITGFPALISGIRYQTIVFPGSYSRTTLNTETKARFNVTNEVLDGVAIATICDSSANLISGVASDNNASLVVFGNPNISSTSLKGGSLRELNDNISAQVAALRVLRLTTGQLISDIVSSFVGPKDIVGGSHMASLPYFNTPMSGMVASSRGVGFTTTELTALKTGGISTIGNNTADTGVLLGEVVTTYLTDIYGNSDLSFKYLNYVDTLSQIREYFVSNLKAQYAQTRLSNGSTTPGYSMATKASIGATILGFYNDMSDIALTPNDPQSVRYVKNNLSVTLDLANGLVTIAMKLPIIVQLRTIIGAIQLSFDTSSS